jgi:hypothetical protein
MRTALALVAALALAGCKPQWKAEPPPDGPQASAVAPADAPAPAPAPPAAPPAVAQPGAPARSASAPSPADERTIPTNIPGVVESLKKEMIALSGKYPELSGVDDIHTGPLPNTDFYGLDYRHNFRPTPQGGWDEAGANAARIRFVIHPLPQGGQWAPNMPVPVKTYTAMNTALFITLETGSQPTEGFKAEMTKVLARHITMIDEIERRARAKGMVPVPEAK